MRAEQHVEWLQVVDGAKARCYQTKLGSTCLQTKPNLLTLDVGKRKRSVYYRVPSRKSEQPVLKRPRLPDVFQGKVFKD